MKNEQTAIEKADVLLLKILETQTHILAITSKGASGGKDLGEFISALRDRLEEMYQQKS